MRKEFLKIIHCPICKSSNFELQIKSEDNIEIREGQLLCLQCRIIFSIKKGILFFDQNISSEARREREALEKEIEEQKDLIPFHDENWLLNFPFNKKIGIDARTERMARLGIENVLLFLKKFNWRQGINILELGAGNCWLTARLAKNYNCVALDILIKFPKGLGAADVFLKNNNVFFERIAADMRLLPFQNNSFDIVLVNAALHHSSNLLKTLQEINRVLSPNGQLIILNEPSTGWFGGTERDQLSRDRQVGFSENRYTLQEWITNFNKAGFVSKIYLPSNLLEIIKTKHRPTYLFNFLLRFIPQFLRRTIINYCALIILFFFDGFFNAILKKDVHSL